MLLQIFFPVQHPHASATCPSAVSSYYVLAFCMKLYRTLMSQHSVKGHSHLCLSVMLTEVLFIHNGRPWLVLVTRLLLEFTNPQCETGSRAPRVNVSCSFSMLHGLALLGCLEMCLA